MTVAPRWATPRTPSRLTYGPAIAKVAEAMGTPLMPWQQQVVDVATEVLADGSWAYTTVIVTIQRQGGKTTLVGAKNLHRCMAKRNVRTWFTAQKRQDARDTLGEINEKAKRSAFRRRFIFRRSNGSEGFTFGNGSSFRVFAPTEDALHGKSNESVDVDEAWAFDAVSGTALEQAILPTFTTTGGQLWIVSTAGTAASVWFRRMVDGGRADVEAGSTQGTAYFEWSLTDEQAELVEQLLDPTQPPGAEREANRERALQLLYDAHPAKGYTLKLAALRQATKLMKPGEILRAYGNRWTHVADSIIPMHLWNSLGSTFGPPEPGAAALAFDVSPDRSHAVIGAAWREGGRLRLDLVEFRDGDAWVAARLVELVRRWRVTRVGYDKQGPALDVADELARLLAAEGLADVVVGTSLSEHAASCAGFYADAINGRVEHRRVSALDDAVAAAGKRDVGDGGWVWSRRESTASIAALVAVTAARWALDHRPPPRQRPSIGVLPRDAEQPPAATQSHETQRRPVTGTGRRVVAAASS